MATAWWRRTLGSRLTAVVVMALVLWLAITAVAVDITLRRAARTIVDQWEGFGRHIAARVESEIEAELRRLDRIAEVMELGADPARLEAAVRDLRLAESAVWLSRDGGAVWARSTGTGSLEPLPVKGLARPDGGWRGHPTDVVSTERGPRAWLILPARESDPRGGAIAALLVPGRGALAGLVASYGTAAYAVDLVDANGRPLAVSRHGRADPGDDPLAASVAVPGTSWSVRLAQPRSEALASVEALRRLLVGGSIVLMMVALLMAWGTARSIRQPVERLTRAAERLTHGGLETPIAGAGEDEIGRLAQALEALRRALQQDERRGLLLRRVLAVQEDERRRIARELHDQTTQELTALALQLDAAARSGGASAADLTSTRERVSGMIDEVHRLIHDLRPSMLDDLGLLPAIHWFATTHLSPHGIDVHVEMPDEAPAFDPVAATAVYRVVQEAITNVVRHANAEAVQVACSLSDATLTIEVEDDGRGFDPAAMSRPRQTGEGLGLLGMRERLALVGGRLTIDAAPGSGTRVVIEAPMAVMAPGGLEARS